MKRFRDYCTVIKFNIFKSWWTESTICNSGTTLQVQHLGPPWRKTGDIVKILLTTDTQKRIYKKNDLHKRQRSGTESLYCTHISGELSAPIIRDWIIPKGWKVFKTKEKTSINPRSAFGWGSGEMLIKCHVVLLLCIISIKPQPHCIQTWYQDRYK